METLHEAPEARIATIDDILLVDIQGYDPKEHEDPGMRLMEAIEDTVFEQGRVAMLVRLSNCKLPTSGVDPVPFQRVLQRHAERFTSHVVIESEHAFLGAAVRAVVSAVAIIGFRRVDMHFHADLVRARRAFVESRQPSPEAVEQIDAFFAASEPAPAVAS